MKKFVEKVLPEDWAVNKAEQMLDKVVQFCRENDINMIATIHQYNRLSDTDTVRTAHCGSMVTLTGLTNSQLTYIELLSETALDSGDLDA